MNQLTATQAAQAKQHVAVLRGLYGDIGESLHDPAACNELWAQIEDAHGELATLIPRVAESV